MVLDAGGGGGDSRERFAHMPVPAMWAMLQNHDSGPHYQALEGWRQSYELVLMHRTRVEKYKEKLIKAWPPERSKAAYNYIERLDHLIDSLTETYEAAIANHAAYASAIAAVDDTKRRMNTIRQEHTANEAALSAYEEEVRNRPLGYGKAVAPPPPPSPVADGRQEELRLQAASLMTGLTAELATAQTSLTAPRPYTPLLSVTDSKESIGSAPISTILPSSSSFVSRVSSSIQGTDLARTGNHAKTANPALESKGPDSPKARKPFDGPILGEAKPQNTAPTRTSTTTPTNVPTIPDPYNITLPQGTSSGAYSRYPEVNGGITRGAPIGSNPLGRSSAAPTGRGASPLQGNVIGGTPHIGGGPSGRGGTAGSSSRTTQRVNPLGGLIGSDSTALPSRRMASNNDHGTPPRSWDPDNPWEIEAGVDPILRPQPEKPINPGPTIGGL